MAHAAGAKVVLDNVFATPILQQGFPLGVDVVMYSGTKHIDGQGRVLGGAILGDKQYIDELMSPRDFVRESTAAVAGTNWFFLAFYFLLLLLPLSFLYPALWQAWRGRGGDRETGRHPDKERRRDCFFATERDQI